MLAFLLPPRCNRNSPGTHNQKIIAECGMRNAELAEGAPKTDSELTSQYGIRIRRFRVSDSGLLVPQSAIRIPQSMTMCTAICPRASLRRLAQLWVLFPPIR